MKEEDLVERAKLGDESAWHSLMHSHQEVVFRFAYLRLGSAEEAEEAAQETFIQAFKHIQSFNLSKSFRPWLMGIVNNLSKNRWRSSARYHQALGRYRETQSDEDGGPEHIVTKNSDRDEVLHALSKLAHADQELILLRFFLKLTVKETAQAIRISEGTVKSRTSRSLGRLERVIRREFPHLQEGWES